MSGTGRFEHCVEFVLRQEGGYADDPDDPGGATNMGITEHELDCWRDACGRPRGPVRDMPRSEAVEIYRAWYWERVRAGSLAPPLDLALVDFAVNCGRAAAVARLQRLAGASVDGVCGTETVLACSALDPVRLASDLTEARRRYYEAIAAAHPVMRRFLETEWLPRIRHVLAEISDATASAAQTSSGS